MVAYTFNTSMWETGAVSEFKASLVQYDSHLKRIITELGRWLSGQVHAMQA